MSVLLVELYSIDYMRKVDAQPKLSIDSRLEVNSDGPSLIWLIGISWFMMYHLLPFDQKIGLETFTVWFEVREGTRKC